MSNFKKMSSDDIWSILNEVDASGNKIHIDVLTPMANKETDTFKNVSCPVCGSYGSESFINTSRPFSPSSPLPNKLLRCSSCRTEYDPLTKLVTLASPINAVLD
jgi:formate dehydrogenase maturation protein FdhE